MSSNYHARNVALGATAFFVSLLIPIAGVSRLLVGGFYNDSSQMLGSFSTHDITLAEVDADDDLNLYLAAWFGGDAVWLNDGAGLFSDSGQALSTSAGTDVALVDVAPGHTGGRRRYRRPGSGLPGNARRSC